MAEAAVATQTTEAESASRIYEIGYHIIPTIQEADVEKAVGAIRSRIEAAGGSFVAEGAPTLMRLAYPMDGKVGDKRIEHDRGYFGWIKFELAVGAVRALEEALGSDPNVLRHVLFETVREDTRAKIKAPTIREVKTHVSRVAPRRAEEESAPVSEADLDKALLDITTD